LGYCVLGLIGVQCLNPAVVPINPLVRLRVGTAAGLGDIFDGYRRIVANVALGGFIAPENAFFVVNTMSLENSLAEITARAMGGTYGGVSIYVTWTLSNTGAPSAWTVRRTTAWNGFAARVKPSRALGGLDLGELQRAYGGAEFSDLRNTKRSVSATFTDLDDKHVRGGTRGVIPGAGLAWPIVTANIWSINSRAGITRPVVFVPNSNVGASGYSTPDDSTGRDWNADYVAQAEIIYGYLQKPLEARELGRINSSESFFEADFTIVDAFNGLT